MDNTAKRRSIPRNALRLFGNRLVCSLLTLMMFLSLSSLLPSETVTTAAVISAAAGLLYTFGSSFRMAVGQGDRDRNLHSFDRIPAEPLRGLRTGLLAEAPALLLFLFLIATRGTELYMVPTMIHMIVSCQYWCLLIISPSPWILLPALLLVPLASALGYLAGFRQIPLPAFLYRRKK